MFNPKEFIKNIPATTRERESIIKETLNSGKIYISLINRNDKKCFKIYTLDGDAIKTTQLKVSQESLNYILKFKDNITFSDKCKDVLKLN